MGHTDTQTWIWAKFYVWKCSQMVRFKKVFKVLFSFQFFFSSRPLTLSSFSLIRHSHSRSRGGYNQLASTLSEFMSSELLVKSSARWIYINVFFFFEWTMSIIDKFRKSTTDRIQNVVDHPRIWIPPIWWSIWVLFAISQSMLNIIYAWS